MQHNVVVKLLVQTKALVGGAVHPSAMTEAEMNLSPLRLFGGMLVWEEEEGRLWDCLIIW